MTKPLPRSELRRRPNGSGREPTRSMRIGDSAWELMQTQAAAEGLSVGAYLTLLVTEDATRRLGGSPVRSRLKRTLGARAPKGLTTENGRASEEPPGRGKGGAHG